MVMYGGKLALLTSRLVKSRLMSIREMSTAVNADCVKSLLYKEYGDPIEVLQVTTQTVEQPANDQVSVKWLLAPVNPADINTIQGKYPSRPPLPAIPGNEGVGEIVAIGSSVQTLRIGDKVVPNGPNFGTWRTLANYNFKDVMKMPSDVDLVAASMMNVNPCTAYRMLKDFVPLKPGDTVIQNGGNSAVGQLVIQLCKIWNYKSVSVVRDRPNIQELKNQLTSLGADEVLTEAEVRGTQIFKSKKLPTPRLALNCIGGQSAHEVLRHLAQDGIMVTYGGMSREPLTIPIASLIFKNISFKGFWMTAWTQANTESQEREDMFKDLATLFRDKKLQPPPHKLVPFCEYQEAISKALSFDGKTGVKYILDLTKS
ncbi:Probable trans-2-enoyl-CoA reductase, mitochondrial [Camponotus floridanus]|uniref:Enoyl-[acyl-carrier-protein] reductase, mitochondrial n=1 Tax=Camponotus floridanus TaxID=104421 RepID=E2AV36_CAMFO|nr:enoyl-[acyl-carrier-protein] reductase, mitochondrial [Camponotus floridanus]EFN62703.1 Probable trans-2-enoyl-CoA reductase, mitochondrial [Camponotus floridanus]